MTSKQNKSDFDKLLEKTGAQTGRQYEAFTKNLPVLSTGIFMLDAALGPIDFETGVGGIRARDIVEICGIPGAGKSCLLHSAIKATQQRYPGQSVVGLYSEPPDIPRMEREGIDVDNLLIVGAYHDDITEKQKLAEHGLDALLDLCQEDQIKLCVIDSVGNLYAESQIYNPNSKERSLWDSTPVAGLAKTFNKFASDYTKKSKRAPLLMANHYRDPIATGGFSVPNLLEVNTPGGRTKEFLSMVRIRAFATPIWAEAKHSQMGNRIQTGLAITYRMFRNKYANRDAFRSIKVNFDFETCEFNNEESIIRMCEYFGDSGTFPSNALHDGSEILGVRRTGAWYSIGDQKFAGMANAVQYVKENPQILERLAKEAMSKSAQFFRETKEDE
jgi:RecA/RadA recombinase